MLQFSFCCKNEKDDGNDFLHLVEQPLPIQAVVYGPAAAASPGSLLELQTLRPYSAYFITWISIKLPR